MLKNCLKALQSLTPRKTYTQEATENAKRLVNSWSRKDVRLQRVRYPRRNAIFINKPPKSFNLAEIARLVRLDSCFANEKFRFMSDDPSLDDLSTAPIMKRLLNNSLYYAVHHNSPHNARKLLEEMDVVCKETQVYLIESTRGYKECAASPRAVQVPIDVDGTIYKLETPSVALLMRMEGVGVPLDHPEHNRLIKSRLPHPLIPEKTISFHSIQGDKLIALIPSHILEHQRYIQAPPAEIGPIVYEGQEHTLTSLTQLLCKKLNVPMPFMTIAPFIVNRYYMDDKPITTNVNGHEVLNSEAFPQIPVIDTHDKATTHNDLRLLSKNKVYPLSMVHSGEVYDMLQFYQKSKKFGKIGVITADMLRSVILDHDVISVELLQQKKLVLEVLHYCMGVIQDMSKDMSNDMDIKECQPEDMILLKALYQMDNSVDAFAETLAKYLMVIDAQMSYTDSRTKFLNQFLGYVLHEALHGLQKLFPEFSQMWLTTFDLHNKPTHKYPIGDIHKDTQTLMDVVTIISATTKFPQPYAYNFEITDSLYKHKDLLQHVANRFDTQLSFVSELGVNDKRDYLYHSDVVVPYRPYPELHSVNKSLPWYQLLQNLDITKLNDKTRAKVKHDIKLRVQVDDTELQHLNKFINKVLSYDIEQNIIQFKKRKMTPPDDSFKSISPDKIEKEINEFI